MKNIIFIVILLVLAVLVIFASLDVRIMSAYILLGAGALIAIAAPLVNAIGQPKNLIRSLIGLAALIVIFIISYALASGELQSSYESFEVSTQGAKRVGGAIITVYILFFIAVGGIVFTEIAKIFK